MVQKFLNCVIPILDCGLKAFFTLLVLFGARWVRAENIALSTRALGMGNAYTGVVNDHDSIFYNPAGLARMSGFRWTVLDPSIGMNNIDSYEEYADLFGGSDDMATVLNELYGNSIKAYLGANKSLFSVGSFTFGAYGAADAHFFLNNPAFPNLETNYNVDYGFVAGWGMEFIPKMLSIGLQSRRITRQGGNIPLGASTLATLNSEDIEAELNASGTAYAADLGVNIMFPNPWNPTLSFVWRDMGMTSFKPVQEGGAVPGPVNQEMILGLGMTWTSTLMDIRTAIDYRYLNVVGRQVGMNLGIGLEFNFPILDVRAGVHQGYYTLGTTFDLWLMRIDLASYGVELGAYPGQLEDRRYMLQLTIDFAFDPSFNFLGSGGRSKSRHSNRVQRR